MTSISRIAYRIPNYNTANNNVPTFGSRKKNNEYISPKLMTIPLIIGLGTLNGCTFNEDFVSEEPNVYTLGISKDSVSKSNNIHMMSTQKYMDYILNTLGILDSNSTIGNIISIALVDNNDGCTYHFAFDKINESEIKGKSLVLTPNGSEKSKSTFTIYKSSLTETINLKINDNNNNNTTYAYKVLDDNSVMEYRKIEQDFLLECSIYKKQQNDTITRNFFDGRSICYKILGTDLPYPTQIVFNATTADPDTLSTNINLKPMLVYSQTGIFIK